MALITNTEGHFSLHAYVCGADCVRFKPMGRVTFSHIYQARPMGCRYAVVGMYDITLHDDRYYVFDLYSVWRDYDTGRVRTPRPRLTHTDLDAAILATVMLYEDGGR